MPKAKNVKPKKWTNIIVLYDDNVYSTCFGNFEGSHKRIIGERWNNNYPRQGNNPTWYVVYDPFKKSKIENIKLILEQAKQIKGLHRNTFLNKEDINANILDEDIDKYIHNCNLALKEIENNI